PYGLCKRYILLYMEEVYKIYRFKLMPDAAQEILLAKHFGCVRFVYNHFLSERIAQYKKDKKSDNYQGQALALTQLKKKEERIWLNEVNSQTLQFALKSLDAAFVSFFKNRFEFQRFKSKKKKNT